MAFGAVDLCDQMNAILNNEDTPPSVAVRRLVDQHGVWPVMRALAAVLLPKRGEVIHLDSLSPHLRRDMGLPPQEMGPKYWELR